MPDLQSANKQFSKHARKSGLICEDTRSIRNVRISVKDPVEHLMFSDASEKASTFTSQNLLNACLAIGCLQSENVQLDVSSLYILRKRLAMSVKSSPGSAGLILRYSTQSFQEQLLIYWRFSPGGWLHIFFRSGISE